MPNLINLRLGFYYNNIKEMNMSKLIFNQEAIKKLKEKDEVTYISEKSISLSPEFRIKIVMCKTKYDAVILFENIGI